MKDFENIKQSFKSLRSTMILVIIATVAIGLIYIFSPVPAMEVICYIIAALMCVCGVFSFVQYFVKSKDESFGSFGLVKGVALVVFGIFVFLNPALVSNMLATLVGIAMIIDGAVKAQYAVDLLRFKSQRWWHILIPAAAVLVLGIIIAFNPAETAKGFMIFVGISLLVDALCDLFSIFYLSSAVKALNYEDETALTETE